MQYEPGTLTVISGCMFAGKTDRLIRILTELARASNFFQVFKPSIDDRYSTDEIVTHDGLRLPCTVILASNPEEILTKLVKSSKVLGLDEGQFLDPKILTVVRYLLSYNYQVIVAGLDADFRGIPFGPMPELIAMANKVIPLKAKCNTCGGVATKTQRLINGKPAPWDSPVVYVGGTESYEARCLIHHKVPK